MGDTVGARIAFARNMLGAREGHTITQAELSRRVGERLPEGLAYNAISRYEAGEREPSRETLGVIADLTGVDPGWLTYGALSDAPWPPGWEPPENDGGGQPLRAAEPERTTVEPTPEERQRHLDASPPKRKPRAS